MQLNATEHITGPWAYFSLLNGAIAAASGGREEARVPTGTTVYV